MRVLPSGTLTFLMTDIEGSTRLWQMDKAAMSLAVAQHNRILTDGVISNGGQVIKDRGEGDSFFTVFDRPSAAIAAACAIQRQLQSYPWPTNHPIRVRIAIHTGEASPQDDDYYDPTVNRCARLKSVAHGGQTVLSAATAELVGHDVPKGASLEFLGEHRLKDLLLPMGVFQLNHVDLQADFPPLNSLDPEKHNLPVQPNLFIGRQQALEKVTGIMRTTRLLTLTGAGGTGKTRLALQAGAEMLEYFSDGVKQVMLEAVTEPQGVPEAVARALGLSVEAGRTVLESLIRYLKERRILLLLDNCEHLIDGCARLADTLLRTCPGVSLLTTSRVILNVDGETTWQVPTLRLPDPAQDLTLDELAEFEGIQLFVDRAKNAFPDFALTATNAGAVAEVCHRLDGIALAIELAARRVRSYTPEQIAALMKDRFGVLTGGSRTAPERHRTLTGLVAWSHDLLSLPERVLWRRLSVFRGGFTLESAQAICGGGEIKPGAVQELLPSLVDQSIVVAEFGGREARYRLLETLREFGVAKLEESGEELAVRSAHRDYFQLLAERARDAAWQTRAGEAFARLEMEHANIQAALEWAKSEGIDPWLRMAEALYDFWSRCGHPLEGRQVLEELAGAVTQLSPRRAQLLLRLGELAHLTGDWRAALAASEETLSCCQRCGNSLSIAAAWHGLANVQADVGALEEAARGYMLAAELFGQSGDRSNHAIALAALAITRSWQGQGEEAAKVAEKAVTLARAEGSSQPLAAGLRAQGFAALVRGEADKAIRPLRQAVEIQRDLGNRPFLGKYIFSLALAASALGETLQALDYTQEAFDMVGDRRTHPYYLDTAGIVLCAAGLSEPAAIAFGGAEVMREVMEIPRSPFMKGWFDKDQAVLREDLGWEAYAAAWERGRTLPLKDLLAYLYRAVALDMTCA